MPQKKNNLESDHSWKKQRRLNIQISTAKANRDTEVDNDNTFFQAKIATEFIYHAAAVAENSRILKNKQWFMNFCTSWHITFKNHIFISKNTNFELQHYILSLQKQSAQSLFPCP